MKQFLECGKIINTHGIRGEVKIEPWCDSPESLLKIKTLYIDGKAVHVLSSRVHKACVLAMLEGTDDINKAMLLKGKVVFLDRKDMKIPKGSFFIQDVIGMPVFDETTNRTIGEISDVMTLPAGNIYMISGACPCMIPAVPEFIKDIDFDANIMRVRTIDGMIANDED